MKEKINKIINGAKFSIKILAVILIIGLISIVTVAHQNEYMNYKKFFISKQNK
jgi:hypothetical protein